MTFYLISGSRKSGKPSETLSLLQQACANAGIAFTVLDLATTDPLHLPVLVSGDMLYRSAIHPKARLIEKLMLNDSCTHIYPDLFSALSSHGGSFFHHQRMKISTIPTIPFIPEANESLEKIVADLGGVPLVVKIVGGSLGVGVIRVDSLESLRSLVDYLRGNVPYAYIRKYIKHDYYVRAAVIGGEVVASHKTYSVEGEFRTNAVNGNDQRREPVVLPQHIQQMAVEAAAAIHIEFAGVDILFDEAGIPYIAEVNSPFDFSGTQALTGIDIAGKLVAYLAQKATA